MHILALSLFTVLVAFFSPSHAEASCLEIRRDNTFSAWVNTCNRVVYVNWTDDHTCRNWSCASKIGPLKTSTATITRKSLTTWCEWYDGATGKGPCDGSTKVPPDQSTSRPVTKPAPSPYQIDRYGRCANDPTMVAEMDARYAKSGAMIGKTLSEIKFFVDYFAAGNQNNATWKQMKRIWDRCG